jgi:hypothetical protein
MNANKAPAPAQTSPRWSLSPRLDDTVAGADVDEVDKVVEPPAEVEVAAKLPIALTTVFTARSSWCFPAGEEVTGNDPPNPA